MKLFRSGNVWMVDEHKSLARLFAERVMEELKIPPDDFRTRDRLIMDAIGPLLDDTFKARDAKLLALAERWENDTQLYGRMERLKHAGQLREALK